VLASGGVNRWKPGAWTTAGGPSEAGTFAEGRRRLIAYLLSVMLGE